MTQCWLHGRRAGSQLPAAPGQQQGGSRSPWQPGETGPVGWEKAGAETPRLARELELRLAGSVPRAAGTGVTHSAAGVEGQPHPPGPTGSVHPFGRGDLHAWPRERQCRVPAGSGQDSAQPGALAASPRGSLAPRGLAPAPVLLVRVSWAALQALVSPMALPCSLPCAVAPRPALQVGSAARLQNCTKTRGGLPRLPPGGRPAASLTLPVPATRTGGLGHTHLLRHDPPRGKAPLVYSSPLAVPRTCRALPNGHTGRPLQQPGAMARGRGAPAQGPAGPHPAQEARHSHRGRASLEELR